VTDRLGGGGGSNRKRGLLLGAGVLTVVLLWVLVVFLVGGLVDDEGRSAPDGVAEEEATRSAEKDFEENRKAAEQEEARERKQKKDEAKSKKGDADAVPPATEEHDTLSDPLGTGASSEDLSETGRERIELAASNFVVATYGYTGQGEEALSEYTSKVNLAAMVPEFYESPGSEEVRKHGEQISGEGLESAAEMSEFRLLEQSPERVTGTAHFEVGEAFNDAGELAGDVEAYSQDLELVKWGAGWRVEAAGPRQDA
jgi:hypothetical protein